MNLHYLLQPTAQSQGLDDLIVTDFLYARLFKSCHEPRICYFTVFRLSSQVKRLTAGHWVPVVKDLSHPGPVPGQASGCYLSQRDKDKITLFHPGMRNGQLKTVDGPVTIHQDVDIQGSWSPADLPDTMLLVFDGLAEPKQFHGDRVVRIRITAL